MIKCKEPGCENEPTRFTGLCAPHLAEWEESPGLLTQAEVDALADGTEIEVRWIGGNGPHRYILRATKWGQRWAAMPDADLSWPDLVGGALDSAGPTLTMVRLATKPAPEWWQRLARKASP